MKPPPIVIELASQRLRSLVWKRDQAYMLDYGGFDWHQYLKYNQRAEEEIIQLQEWLREVQSLCVS